MWRTGTSKATTLWAGAGKVRERLVLIISGAYSTNFFPCCYVLGAALSSVKGACGKLDRGNSHTLWERRVLQVHVEDNGSTTALIPPLLSELSCSLSRQCRVKLNVRSVAVNSSVRFVLV